MKTISNRGLIASSILLHSQSSERHILQSSIKKLTSDLGNYHKRPVLQAHGMNVQYMNDKRNKISGNT